MTPEHLASIHRDAFTHQRPWSTSEIGTLLGSPGVFVMASSKGFGVIRVTVEEAELLTLAVAPRDQGQGLGRVLLKGLMATARDAGATSMFLEVAADNAPALALYGKLGFAEAGRRPKYYRHPDGSRQDALLMQADLAQTAPIF